MLAKALEKTGAPADAIQFVEVTDRAAVARDARAGRADRPHHPARVARASSAGWPSARAFPILKHDKGLVHVFVDAAADLDMATAIVHNAKTHRPSVCNALETLLVDRAVADRFLPMIAARLGEAGVELRGCPGDAGPRADRAAGQCRRLGRGVPRPDPGHPRGRRISTRPSTTSVVTAPGWPRPSSPTISATRRRFTREVDAAAVLVNASTRLVDGSQFGLGAEMGISTSRVHARGPVGVRELTTTKFIVQGDGQVRD